MDMKTRDFRESIDELHERLVALTYTKGEEYKRREDNQFANFERGAHALGMTREQVLMVYLSKHLDSITTFVKDQAAGEHFEYAEPIEGRIDDAILYLLLLRGMTKCNPVPKYQEECRFSGIVNTTISVVEKNPVLNLAGIEKNSIFLARSLKDASDWCNYVGMSPGTSAISTVDQLHGVKAPTHVFFITRDSLIDNALMEEALERCKRQGLMLSTIAPLDMTP